ncbi:MAG TPA: hypothetical protein DGT23_05780 [Micromonosporaceae bacterium]|nr:hypothetical protein [Micromonosporaceae bacterium]
MGSATTPRLTGEVIGTALLVFFGVGALLTSGGQGFVAAVALLVTVTAAYWVFGGHFNPWITLASAIRGTVDWLGAVAIIVAQLVGGIIGAVLMWAVFHTDGVNAGLGVTRVAGNSTTGRGLLGAILAETIAVFLLACVVFAVGESDRLGVAMGLVYAAGSLAIFVITAASMNLARTVGPEVVMLLAGKETDWAAVGRIWVYVVSGVLGAALAGLLYPMWRPSPAPAAAKDE